MNWVAFASFRRRILKRDFSVILDKLGERRVDFSVQQQNLRLCSAPFLVPLDLETRSPVTSGPEGSEGEKLLYGRAGRKTHDVTGSGSVASVAEINISPLVSQSSFHNPAIPSLPRETSHSCTFGSGC